MTTTPDTPAKLAADFVPRLMAVVKIYQEQDAHGGAVDAELFGAVSRLVAAQALPAAEPDPVVWRQRWKSGCELLPYHPSASHVQPDYRDGWNACYQAAQQAAQATAGWVLVPKVATTAMLRPFYNCPPDELQLAWEALLLITSRAALPQPQPQSAQAKGDAA